QTDILFVGDGKRVIGVLDGQGDPKPCVPNIVTVNLMEAVGEAQVFAERTGLGTGPMEELIGEAFGAVAGGYSKRLTSGAYAPSLDSRPGFGVSLAIKDANHALAIANEQNVRLPGLQ
ncbi:hypothetical protein KXW86_006869, partial [Aspergillus fumigatus]